MKMITTVPKKFINFAAILKMKIKHLIYVVITFCIALLIQKDFNGQHTCLYDDDIFRMVGNFTVSEDLTTISASDHELNLPRPTNLINIPRTVTNAAKRVGTNYISGFFLPKDGKFHNGKTTAIYLINLYRFPSGLIETTHRLISLGKLVI